MATKSEKQEELKKQLEPKTEAIAPEAMSKFKMKDEHFNKEKSFVKDGKADSIKADWRNIHVGGMAMTLKKDVPLSTEQLANFDKDAKKYYLEEIKD